ncbi:MAG: hypothetical protein LRY74_11245 [Shewanella xiamenensis]|nr:hypothetical protein [Shewanella xiamenensis]
MMKLKMLFGLAALTSTAVMAQGPQCNHAQLPYQQMTPVPYDSTPYVPQNTMPEQCSNPEIEAYIADWEAGKIDFNTIKPNDSIAADQRFVKPWMTTVTYSKPKTAILKTHQWVISGKNSQTAQWLSVSPMV